MCSSWDELWSRTRLTFSEGCLWSKIIFRRTCSILNNLQVRYCPLFAYYHLQNRSDKNNKCELTIIYLFCENLYTSVVVWAILLKSQLLSLHLLQNIWILDVERKRVHHWIVSVLYLLGVEVIFGVWTCHCSLSDFRWGHSWTWII